MGKTNEIQTAKPSGNHNTLLVPEQRTLLSDVRRESLIAWFSLYLGIEGRAGSEHTFIAKQHDIEKFLRFLKSAAGTDHPDVWTRSVTRDFLRQLERDGKSPSTMNRVLATLRHASTWINVQRQFLAGNPTGRISDLELDDPEWKGLEPIQVTRLKSAAEQLIQIQRRSNQLPVRNFAILLCLLHTGLRISELLALDLSQYAGKHFRNVRRKGKGVTRKVFLSKDAREALDQYLDQNRGHNDGPIFRSRTGQRLARQHVDAALKAIARQANSTLKKEDHFSVSAHDLRHTFLRQVANRYGVHYAKELAGHASDRYIWRYVQPSDEEKAKAIDTLF